MEAEEMIKAPYTTIIGGGEPFKIISQYNA